MDDLKLIEQSGVSYISTKPGAMHACGHYGHSTMLPGAGKYLTEHRDSFCGTVYFIFQPSEKRLKSAIVMINDKLFDRFPMDAIYGLHNYMNPLMESLTYDRWFVTFRGTGAHGSTIYSIITSHIVDRNVSPLDSVVISVGNTARSFTGSVRNTIEQLNLEEQTKRAIKAAQSVKKILHLWF